MDINKPQKTGFAARLPQVGLLVLSALLSLSLVRNILKMHAATTRLDKARDTKQNLQKENTELKRQLELVKTDAYMEQEARDKLGLAKEGEYILILPDEEVLRRLSPRRLDVDSDVLPEPNWKKWYLLFKQG